MAFNYIRDILFVEKLLPRPAGEELSGAVTAVYIKVQNVYESVHLKDFER